MADVYVVLGLRSTWVGFRAPVLGRVLERSLSLLVAARGNELRRLFGSALRRWQLVLPTEVDLASGVFEAQESVQIHDVQIGLSVPWLLYFRPSQGRRLVRLRSLMMRLSWGLAFLQTPVRFLLLARCGLRYEDVS